MPCGEKSNQCEYATGDEYSAGPEWVFPIWLELKRGSLGNSCLSCIHNCLRFHCHSLLFAVIIILAIVIIALHCK